MRDIWSCGDGELGSGGAGEFGVVAFEFGISSILFDSEIVSLCNGIVVAGIMISLSPFVVSELSYGHLNSLICSVHLRVSPL